ncbi:alpha/beta fold hydrolase [Phenylobacterium sp.]|uniref:alpha/beta fold hydrolase n=1 Tax=Phenylobacterium sp. TaxID=1871053 RepID=UPI00272F0A97|nr:alpha/beta hydrolase [Phenylobacterium sp.]MDP1615806.1 alpha/beta hydrolase [Phenylobacterium sp.]MDP1986953.1 alpha/beta hydrolase [Phenylobacterium sp.]
MDGMVDATPRVRRFPLPSRGGEMAALEFGPAERDLDLIFCHANGFNAQTYRTILAPLATTLRILAIDLRGHGATTLPTVLENRPGWAEYRDDLLALLPHVASRPVVVAGHSMGATTSLMAAAEDPARIARLVLFDPVLSPDRTELAPVDLAQWPLVQGALRRRPVFDSREAALAAYQGRGAFKTWSGEQLADYVAAGFRDLEDGRVELACAPAWEASNFSVYDGQAWAAAQTCPRPVRIFRAEQGSTCRIDDHIENLTATGRYRIETVPGTSHFLPMERPDLVREALAQAVGEVAA